MAIVDLTKFNPWAGESEAFWRRQNARSRVIQGALDSLNNNIDRGIARRQKVADENRAIRDREYALINRETDNLVQPHSNSKITDIQLQNLGQQFKQEYYDAIKTYQDSDKSDEARQQLEQVKQRVLGSARTVSGAIEALSGQVEAFRQNYNDGGISDAVNPAIREFMADLIDPETPKDRYNIVPDPETGQLRYQGVTESGHEVNFLLDDIANGENQFTSMKKVDMPQVINNLMKDVSQVTKQEKRDWGVAEVTDWDAMGEALGSRMDMLIKDEGNFRSIAAELGYDYNAFQAIKNGEGFVDSDGREINNEDDLRSAVKQELMEQIESVTPHQEKAIIDNRPSVADQVNTEQALNQAVSVSQSFESAVENKNSEAFNGYLNKPAVLDGLKGNISSITMKGNKVQLVVRSGQKGGAKKEFNLSKPDELALFQSIVTGQDYNLIKQANINSLLLQ